MTILRNLSILVFLGLAACGGAKSPAKAPANSSTAATPDTSSTDQCCCMTEMHSCSMTPTAECEGQCGDQTADKCDCEDGDNAPPDSP